MRKSSISFFIFFIAITVSLGGLLFGYNTAVISGALNYLKAPFDLTLFEEQFVVSILLLGALSGALIGGGIADYMGRKNTLFSTVILFLLGTFFLVTAEHIAFLYLGRVILGFAIGVVSVVVPLYISEISPPKFRGALVSFNQLAITLGILLAYLVDYYFTYQESWRSMFGFAFIPSVLLFLGLFLVPETPSFLLKKGKKDKARAVMNDLLPHGKNDLTSFEGAKEKSDAKISFKKLVSKTYRAPFLVGISISVIQQVTGINTIIYYSPKIFKLAGFLTEQNALLGSIAIGSINVFVTIISLWIIDIVGRKPLLVVGLIGMILSLFILGLAFYHDVSNKGMISLVSLVAYIAFFAISLGPIGWLMISEIYPLAIRGKAMGIAVFANWSANYIVSFTFLSLLAYFGAAYTFWLYALIAVFSLIFVLRMVPETKHKSFEEIQNYWKKKR